MAKFVGDREAIKKKVLELAAEHVGSEYGRETNEETSFQDLGFDSLDNVEFIMKVEDEFGRDIPDSDAEKILNIGAVVNYLDTQVNGAPLPADTLQAPPPIVNTNL